MVAERFSWLSRIKTPSYVIDADLLERNLKILRDVKQKTGCSMLLALKSFAAYRTFPLIRKYLDGVCASGPWEARLGYEEFGKEVHVYAPAFSKEDMQEVLKYADHIVFNSFSQWKKYRGMAQKKKCGIRINPEYSEVKVQLYNPCAKNSRLGVTAGKMEDVSGISGLHFHALCEQNSDVLKRLLEHVEKNFGPYLRKAEWVNFGGGHHITRDGYDRDLLCSLINSFRKKYGVEVYLEPGEAVALNAGYLVASVLDIVDNGMKIAILDTSAENHMPDVLAMPYRPDIIGAGKPGEKKFTYRLGGLTCLAGDVIGDYSFDTPLKAGSKLVFLDMAHYSMVKNTTFNGIKLPSIAIIKKGKIVHCTKFGYKEYRARQS
ncbi:carboxynorspermidine decarboxylase [Candidatus Woesearchaeota archaeon]|nr:carboxynorspermidine decarboxylase [Candidatus Woesearchaeota archaeon]